MQPQLIDRFKTVTVLSKTMPVANHIRNNVHRIANFRYIWKKYDSQFCDRGNVNSIGILHHMKVPVEVFQRRVTVDQRSARCRTRASK